MLSFLQTLMADMIRTRAPWITASEGLLSGRSPTQRLLVAFIHGMLSIKSLERKGSYGFLNAFKGFLRRLD